MPDDGNGWGRHKLWVEAKFIDHDHRLEKVEEKMDELTQAPGRLAIALLAIILGAASSGVTTWLVGIRQQSAMTQEDRDTQRAIKRFLERLDREQGEKETAR